MVTVQLTIATSTAENILHAKVEGLGASLQLKGVKIVIICVTPVVGHVDDHFW